MNQSEQALASFVYRTVESNQMRTGNKVKRNQSRALRNSTNKMRQMLIEQFEPRLLMSYTLSDIGNFPSNGQQPTEASGVVIDSHGNLYGTVESGGSNHEGAVFELASGSNTVTTLASFSSSTGEYPYLGLTIDSSGNLYGVTDTGGSASHGTVFEIAANSSTITTLASFTSNSGYYPEPGANMIVDSSGNLYGTTEYGGANSTGTVFEVVANSGTVTPLASFSSSTTGQNSVAPLTRDSAGNLYGTNQSGGAHSDGTVFEVTHNASSITPLVSFSTSEGSQTSLIADTSGNLYGTSLMGGSSSVGTVFKVTAGSGTITTLATFNTTNGSYPEGTLAVDSNGNLYGATEAGGANSVGTVFEYSLSSGTITTLASVNYSTTGGYPSYGVVMDSSGNLYGSATDGGANSAGDIFEASPPVSQAVITTQPTIVVAGTLQSVGVSLETAFGTVATSDTAIVTLSLASGPSGGAISGTTSVSAVSGVANFTNLSFSKPGTYTLTVASSGLTSATTNSFGVGQSYTISDIADASNANGYNPYAGLYMDPSGNLYGTYIYGGAYGDGSVFKISANTHAFSVLASFNGTDGESPEAGLIAYGNGNLYGTTGLGGTYGDGTVFEIASGTDTITTLASFNGTDGSQPEGNLYVDSSGNLYGTTHLGGANSDGSVYEIVHGTSTITTLASMNTNTGTDPTYCGVVMDSAGNLYGTAESGGTDSAGSVWELASNSSTLTQIAAFNGTNGSIPYGSLVIDSQGNLYGTTTVGGAYSEGTIFKIAAGSGTVTTIASLSATTGDNPRRGLLMDSSGDLFTQTFQGSGATASGTVIEIPAGTTTVNVLADLSSANGSEPIGPLIMDSAGNLYGTARGGGANNLGEEYELAVPVQPATYAAITSQPTNITAGAPQTVTVSLDSYGGVVDINNTSTVTLAISEGPSGATLGGTLSVAAVNGVATFTGLTFDTAGTYILDAASQYPVTTSSAITVSAGSYASIDFINQPQSAVAGQTLGTVSVGLLDAYGNPISASQGDFVDLQLFANNGESLLGTSEQPLVNGGYEIFSNLSIDTADANDQLLAVSSINSDTVLSNFFSITPAAASKLAFTQQPADTVAGQTMSPIQVSVEDAYGNLVTTGNSGVVVQDSPMVLNGTISASVINGTATFNQLYVTQAGTYTITAGDWNLSQAVSASFTVTPAAAAQLAFVQQPTGTTAGQTMNPVEVAVEDTYGNVVTNNVSGVIVQSADSADLDGTISASVINGIATFNQLYMTQAGTHTMTAGDADLISATSSSFNIAAANPAKLVLTQQPANSTAGQSIGTVEVAVEDAFGNLVADDQSNVTISAQSAGGSSSAAVLTGTKTVAAQNGVAIFSDLAISTGGTYRLTATDSNLTPATTASVTITGTPSPTPNPTPTPIPTPVPDYSGVAGKMMAAIVVNTATAFPPSLKPTKKLTIRLQSQSTGKTVLATAVRVKKGLAVIGNLSLRTTGLYNMTVTDTSGHSMTKLIKIVAAIPAKLVFTAVPTVADGNFTISLQVMDRFGNLTSAADGKTVTLQLAAAAVRGVKPILSGAVTATVQNGVASFANLSITQFRNARLIATASRLQSARSAMIENS